LLGHSRPATAIEFLPDGRQIVSSSADRSLRLWDATSGQTLRVLDNHTDAVHDLALRPGNTGLPLIASVSGDGTLRFWQPTIGRLVRFLRLPAVPLCVAWTLDGQHVILGCTDGHVRAVHCDSLRQVGDWPVLEGWVYAVAVGANDGQFAAGGTSGQVVRLTLEDGPLARLTESE
jgi:WD40 repeat protein